jgi:hypothetical protein
VFRSRAALIALGVSLLSCASTAPVVSAPEAATAAGPCGGGMTVATCPAGSEWDGTHCLRKLVVTQVVCPPGSQWDGDHCVADVAGPGPTSAAGLAVGHPQRQATDRICTVTLRSLRNVHAPEQHIRVHLAAIGCPTWMALAGADASAD